MINDSDEEEAEGEGGQLSDAESEALEGNERAAKDPFKPLEMGRMTDAAWEQEKLQMRSETQRLLRQQHGRRKCRRWWHVQRVWQRDAHRQHG